MLGLFVERDQSAGHLTVTNMLVLRALDAQNSHRYDRFEAPTLTTAKRPTHALSSPPSPPQRRPGRAGLRPQRGRHRREQ